jgi:hypothetical protein
MNRDTLVISMSSVKIVFLNDESCAVTAGCELNLGGYWLRNLWACKLQIDIDIWGNKANFVVATALT